MGTGTLSRLALHAAVAIGGASVLAIEILGTRVLGPFYGVSLYLWSALIAVTLVALSAGYWSGGRLADRGARMRTLGLFLAAAGCWLLLIPWLRAPLLRVAEPFGLRPAVLVASFILFAPPLTLLGMVSPYAIRLRAGSLGEVGRVAGDLYALSTASSVVSALATGFWLIPALGVSRLLTGTGALLLAGGAFAWSAEERARRSGAAALPGLLALGGAALAVYTPGLAPSAALVAHRDSPYADLRVVDGGEDRYLVIDGGTHTIIRRATWESEFRYVQAFELVKQLFDAPGRLLVIGLGGGSVVKNYARAGWDVEAVEIDPAITELARGHFGLRPSEGAVHHADGRQFLARVADQWDVIVLDAFGSSSIPFHLASVEAFRLMGSRLAPRGVLAINVETLGWDDPLLVAFARSLGRVFPHILALPTGEPPDALGNVVLLASTRPLEFDDMRLDHPRNFLHDPYLHWSVVQQNHAWDNRFDPAVRFADRWERTALFTDDRSAVDLLSERVNREARKRLHAEPGLGDAAW